MTMTADLFLSEKDAAEAARVRPEVVRRLVARGDLKAAKLGRGYGITPAALQAYASRDDAELVAPDLSDRDVDRYADRLYKSLSAAAEQQVPTAEALAAQHRSLATGGTRDVPQPLNDRQIEGLGFYDRQLPLSDEMRSMIAGPPVGSMFDGAETTQRLTNLFANWGTVALVSSLRREAARIAHGRDIYESPKQYQEITITALLALRQLIVVSVVRYISLGQQPRAIRFGISGGAVLAALQGKTDAERLIRLAF
jgi:predicted transcriptional regulator